MACSPVVPAMTTGATRDRTSVMVGWVGCPASAASMRASGSGSTTCTTHPRSARARASREPSAPWPRTRTGRPMSLTAGSSSRMRRRQESAISAYPNRSLSALRARLNTGMPTPAALMRLRPETVSSTAASTRWAASLRPYPWAMRPPSSITMNAPPVGVGGFDEGVQPSAGGGQVGGVGAGDVDGGIVQRPAGAPHLFQGGVDTVCAQRRVRLVQGVNPPGRYTGLGQSFDESEGVLHVVLTDDDGPAGQVAGAWGEALQQGHAGADALPLGGGEGRCGASQCLGKVGGRCCGTGVVAQVDLDLVGGDGVGEGVGLGGGVRAPGNGQHRVGFVFGCTEAHPFRCAGGV